MKRIKIITVLTFSLLFSCTRGFSAESDDQFIPINMSLEMSEHPSTEQAIRWKTNSDIKVGVAQFLLDTPSPDLKQNCKEVHATSKSVTIYDTAFVYHRVVFTGLIPATEYLYRVGDGNGKWTEWIQFKTASDISNPFSFLFFGDVQTGILTHYPRVIRQAVLTAPDASFLLFAGDIGNRAYMSEFQDFFNTSGWILKQKPVVAVPGNHEYRHVGPGEDDRELTREWNYMFGIPNNAEANLRDRGCGYFDYQGVRFVLNNSRDLDDGEDTLVADQMAWLEKALNAPDSKFIVVLQHYPIFPMGEGREKKSKHNVLEELYMKHGVDLVLTGHDHIYSRIAPRTKGFQKSVPPAYVLSMAGEKMYVPNFNVNVERMALNTQMFQEISIEGNSLNFKAYDATGEYYDGFVIEKKSGKKRILDTKPPTSEFSELPLSRKSKYKDAQWQQIVEKHKQYFLNRNKKP
ncbi:MAG: metallophosphoesterase family protein [Bacteroidales bacterium]|nr:metallophosphoesterase family protein [Bacteroidales bacterium]